MCYILNMVPFGRCVWLWRLERKLTQNELANRAGVPRPNLSAIERGKRDVSLRTLRSLALALDITPGTLADGVPPTAPAVPSPVTRELIERLADAVIRDLPLKNSREQALAEALSRLMGSRLRALGIKKGRPSRGGKKSAQAWLLASSQSPQFIQTMTERVTERGQKL